MSLRISLILVCVLMIWGVAGTSVLCLPLEAVWTGSPAICIPGIFFVTYTAADWILDLADFLLPIRTVWKLQMSVERRWLTIGAFVCGYW